jgi:hypothetical protein
MFVCDGTGQKLHHTWHVYLMRPFLTRIEITLLTYPGVEVCVTSYFYISL